MATIGVLALQGGYAAHAAALARLGHRVLEVRAAAALAGLDGLVLPGGESSVMLKLMADEPWGAALGALVARGAPVLGTCAGLILLARQVTDPPQHSLGLLDVVVSRNAWGRQLDSFEARDDEDRRHLVFIRAPRIRAVGPAVEVLARYRGEPVLVREGAVYGACFHPELVAHDPLHAAVFGATSAPTRTIPAALHA